MHTFYEPFNLLVNESRTIIYPMLGIEGLVELNKEIIHAHLQKVVDVNNVNLGAYQIAILWADNKDLMTDIWIFSELESLDAGYTVHCNTFRNMTETKDEGITASDGLIMLGREAELEESIRKSGGTIEDYFEAERPRIPGDLVSDKIFE